MKDDALQQMTQNDLRALGAGDVGYVRRHLVNGKTAFILYAADGTALAAQRREHEAVSAAFTHDLEVVTVH